MRSIAGAIFVALTLFAASGASVTSAAPPPVIAACADERLPAELLDGAVTPAEAPVKLPPLRVPAAAGLRRPPLRVIDAVAPRGTLRLAVADDVPTRESGLMRVTHLRPQHGMIFVFPFETDWEFWMKNTLVPLDMIWTSPDGIVTNVAANVPASTRTTRDANVARRRGRGIFVIELPAGEATAQQIAVGTRLTLPPLRATR